MKTILHVIDTTGPGGAETVFADLVTGLPASPYRSVPMVSGPGWLHDTLCAAGKDPLVVRSEERNGAAYLVDFLRVIRRLRPDLIHGHLIGSALYGSIAGRLSGIPALCTFHGPADVPSGDRLRRLRFEIIGRASSRITFVSNALTEWMLAETHLPQTKARVIYNGVDTSRFSTTRDPWLRRHLGLAEGTLLFGALGNLRAPKGYDVLMQALSRLPAAGVDWHMAIAGDITGDVYPRVLQLRDSLGLTDRVTFLGFRHDIAEVLAGFDVFVLPSLTEGFSLATVQAMASGLPVLVTRSGGPEEIVVDGVSGMFVPPGDPDSLRDAIQRLRSDPQLRECLGRNGRERVESRFSLDAMINSYAAEYEAILA